MSWKNKWVRLEKVSVPKGAKFPTPDASEYEPGKRNPGLTVPIGYTVLGICETDVALDERFVIQRYERDGESVGGVLRSSSVQRIEETSEGSYVHTRNSVYRIVQSEEAENKYSAETTAKFH